MKEDFSASETVSSVLSDAIETLYRVRVAGLGQEGTAATEEFRQAYRERDRFKIRFLRALLGNREVTPPRSD